MIAIVCVDADNGMMFNNRRQSQDRKARQNILELTSGSKLWMNEYSFGQFKEEKAEIYVDEGNSYDEKSEKCVDEGILKNVKTEICIDEQFLEYAKKGQFCFVENKQIDVEKLEGLIIYRWDKKYPSDFELEFDFSGWHLKNTFEFEGYSHDKIIREVYERDEKHI